MIMFDMTSRYTYKNVANFYRTLSRDCGNIPIVLCGNKVDSDQDDIKITPKQITFPKKKKLPYFDISVKENYNLEKPFLWLIRKILGKNDVEFVPQPAPYPSVIDTDRMNFSHQEEFVTAVEMVLPNDDFDEKEN
jgi:GTP-binding nuclear protein Ran